MVARAFLVASQLMDRFFLMFHAFLAMSLLHIRGQFAAYRSICAYHRVMVIPLIVRLAWDAGMNGKSLEGYA
jgi:hypothetical protein